MDLDKIVLGDDSLSAREIWGAEYLEDVCVLVKKENVSYYSRSVIENASISWLSVTLQVCFNSISDI